MPEFTLSRPDGRELHVQVWEAGDLPRGLVVLSHGYGEHVGRYEHVAAALTAAGLLVIGPDHVGHGRSSGPRGRIDFPTAVADLDAVVRDQRELHPTLPIVLLGHSMGGGIALRYAIAHGERLHGLVLSGPLVLADANPVLKLIGRLLAGILPDLPVVDLDPTLVSRDPDVVAAYRADPLVRHKPIPAATGAAFVAHAETILEDATVIELPTLLLWGEADGLCPPAGAEALAAALSRAELETHAFPGLYHEILNEPERRQVLDVLLDWLDRHLP